jgi:hypothetical protein
MQDEKTVEIVNQITNYVNTFSRRDDFNKVMSTEHRTLQQSFTRLCLKWLEHVAQDEYKTDPRNEASKSTAKELISKFREEKGFLPSEFLPLCKKYLVNKK